MALQLQLLEHTLVINLAEREDRRLSVSIQLKKIGVLNPEFKNKEQMKLLKKI